MFFKKSRIKKLTNEIGYESHPNEDAFTFHTRFKLSDRLYFSDMLNSYGDEIPIHIDNLFNKVKESNAIKSAIVHYNELSFEKNPMFTKKEVFPFLIELTKETINIMQNTRCKDE